MNQASTPTSDAEGDGSKSKCTNCGYILDMLDAPSRCPECGTSLADMLRRQSGRVVGTRVRSTQVLWGMPLYDVVLQSGDSPESRTAKGVIAIGPRATGVVAFGTHARGAVSVGVTSVGVVSVGVMSFGFVSVGSMAVGALAIGAMGVGVFTSGSMAAGLAAKGSMVAGVVAWGTRPYGLTEVIGLQSPGPTSGLGEALLYVPTGLWPYKTLPQGSIAKEAPLAIGISLIVLAALAAAAITRWRVAPRSKRE